MVWGEVPYVFIYFGFAMVDFCVSVNVEIYVGEQRRDGVFYVLMVWPLLFGDFLCDCWSFFICFCWCFKVGFGGGFDM